MAEIKLILTDLDGTLVQPEQHTASDAVVQSIRAAEGRGVQFAAVTGRPHWMAKELLKTIGFNDPCILEGGALIMNPMTEEVLWSKLVPADTTRASVEILSPEAFVIEYGNGDVESPQDIILEDIHDPALSIWASVPADKAAGLTVRLQKLPEVAVHTNDGPGGDFTRSGIQVTHVDADKEHAVHALLNLLDVDKAHTLAIGDGDNDLPLFRAAGTKVAMGNASDSLKAAADHIVGNVSEDGFAEAVRKFS